MLVFLLYGALWGLAFAGFPYAIALKTGNPAAVNSSFMLFFPFAFLTTTFLPEEALTGWLADGRDVQPGHLRARGSAQPDHGRLGLADVLPQGFAASIGLMVICSGSRALAMRGRINRNERNPESTGCQVMLMSLLFTGATHPHSPSTRRYHHALAELPLP